MLIHPVSSSSPPHWTLSWSSRHGRIWEKSPELRWLRFGPGWSRRRTAEVKGGWEGGVVNIAATWQNRFDHSVPGNLCQCKQWGWISVSVCPTQNWDITVCMYLLWAFCSTKLQQTVLRFNFMTSGVSPQRSPVWRRMSVGPFCTPLYTLSL